MAYHANKGITPHWYTIKVDADIDEKEQTQFQITPLSGVDRMELANEFIFDDNLPEGVKVSSAGLKLALHKGVTGWRNVFDEHGNQPAFNYRLMTMLIDGDTLTELAYQVINSSQMTESETKNS